MGKVIFNVVFISSIAFAIRNPIFAQANKLEAFHLSDVRLLASPFTQAQSTDLTYMLKLDADKLLAPFLKESGLDTTAIGYGNWEGSGLNGHIGGHYLSALSNMYATTGDAQVLIRLNYFVDQLEKCQLKNGDGYLGGVPGGNAMWQAIAEGNIEAGSFSLNNKWVPLYNIHKIYAGLLDAFLIGGNEKAKHMVIKMADWFIQLTSGLSDLQLQTILRSEHGGMNEVFADVYTITGDDRYLQMAKKLSHQKILSPLLQAKDSLTGLHANTQIPKVIGFMSIASVSRDSSWANAADFFWRTVVNNRSVSIGGNSVREHFHPAGNFSSMIESREGPETCNTYNMLKLSKRLFLWNARAEYMDYYERALYNHILSSQHLQGGFVYFTPMRPRHYRVYSQPQQGFWCCVGSGLENHGKYGEMIYAHNAQDIFINLFIPSSVYWKEKGIRLIQATKFPFEEKSTISITVQQPARFALFFRHPSWVKNGEMKITVNDQEVKYTVDKNGYVKVQRVWNDGDHVTIQLPMHTTAEYLPDGSSWASFVHGPIVLAAATDTTDLVGLKADDSRMGHIAHGKLYPIDEAPLILTSKKNFASGLEEVNGKPLHFKATKLIYPTNFNQLELIPFFQVHDARYMIYWRVTDHEGLEQLQRAAKESEKQKMLLEASTIDQVAPGEQQPESDHNFRGHKTETGTHMERHWRTAQGWFSYDLRNKDHKGEKLRVTYFGADRDRNFDIYADNVLIKTVKLDGTAGEKFIEVDYPLPEKLKSKEQITIKFVAHPGSIAGGIYYLRLMKK